MEIAAGRVGRRRAKPNRTMKLTAQTKPVVRKTQNILLALAAALGLPSLSQAAPGGDQDLTLDHPRVRAVLSLHASVTPSLMNEPGILGTAVENVSTNPRAIGLLVAGSSTSAIANPIGEVLQFLSGKLGGSATLVGK